MYNSLCEHLNSQLNDTPANINEGIFDIFSRNGKENEAKGFFGIIGSIFGAISGDDAIGQALKKQEEDAEKNAKKRESDLAKASEDMLVAKMNADFEQRENQLTLANQQKIAAYKAQQRQLKEEAAFWKNNKRQYTAEQLEGFNRRREELYSSLGAIDDEGIVELNRLTTLITTDENGNTLSIEEIKQKAKDDPEFKAQLDKYEKLAKKFHKPMIEGASTEGFYKELGKTYAAGTEISRAQTALTDAKALADDYKKKSEQVSTFNEKKTAHEKAVAAATTAADTVKNFGSTNGCEVDGNGNITKVTLPNLQAATENNNEFKLDEHLNKLQEQGVPQSIIDKARNAYQEAENNGSLDPIEAMNSAVSALSSEEQTEFENAVKENMQTKYNEAVAAKDQADAAVSATPKPDLNDPEFADIKDMTDKQMIEYDVTTDVGKQTQTTITEGLKDAETKVSKLEEQRQQRAAKRKAENEEYQAMQKSKVPDEFKEDVKKAKSGLDPGETKVDGKPGIRVKKVDENGNPILDKDGKPEYEFIPKPGPNASADEQKEYDKQRDKIVLNTKVGDGSGESIEYRDGKYWYKDGDSEAIELDPKDPSDKSEITRIYAEQQIRTEQRALILGKKQELADKLSTCIKDGDLDPEAYKKLSPAEKEAMRDIMSGKTSVEDMFAGVDLAGSAVIDKVNDFKKQHDNLDDKDSFDEYMKDIDDADDIETGEGSDADHDDEDNVDADEEGMLNDDGELETDETEEYTDNEGNTKTRNKKLKNPAKIWRRKKKKNGKGTTSSYYNKDGDSISKKEFKKRMETYKKALKKKKDKQTPPPTNTTTNTQNNGGKPLDPPPHRAGDASAIDYTNLSNWLFERLLNSI